MTRDAGKAGAVAAAVLCIGVLTLTPMAGIAGRTSFPDRLYHERFVADALLNVLLFIPLGFAGMRAWRSGSRAVLAGAAFSLMIELAQLVIPGRSTSPFDVLTNTAGAALGVVLARSAPHWLRPLPATRRALGALALGLALALLLGGPRLFAPSVAASVALVEWTPALEQAPVYPGRLAAVRLGGRDLAPGRVRAADVLRGFARGTDTLHVDLIVGTPPQRRSPVLRLLDRRERDLLVLSADGYELRLVYRRRAALLYLDQPHVSAPGVLRGVRPGQEVVVRAWRERAGDCLLVAGRHFCEARPVTMTWALLLYPLPAAFQGRAAMLVAPVWVAALLLPAGFFMRSPLALALGSASVILLLVLAPRLAPAAATPPLHIAGAVAGLLAGYLLGRAAARAGSSPDAPRQRT